MNTLAPSAETRRLLESVADIGDAHSSADRWARAVWSQLVEPGDSTAGRLVQALGSAAALDRLVSDAPIRVDDVTDKELDDAMRRWMPRLTPAAVSDSLARAVRTAVRLVVPGDDAWPAQLDDLGPHAPLALWVRGRTASLGGLRPSVAIVGARAATSYGEHVAAELSADLAGSGIPVVSGAAYGIDGAAHRSALAVGGATIALLAGGVDRPYPAGHGHLLDRIATNGAIVSEVPCGSAPTKWRFLQRNRLIAALADATIVIEAGWRSGSLNTAGHALALGRAVGAVPGPVTSAASAGCHRLLRESGAVCVTNADDARELLGSASPGRAMEPDDDRPPTDDACRVRDALSTRVWRDTQEIARRAGMSAADVQALLGLLVLGGEVEQSLVGWRRTRVR